MILSPIVVLKITCEMNVIPMMCVKKSSFLLLKRDAFRIVAAVIVTIRKKMISATGAIIFAILKAFFRQCLRVAPWLGSGAGSTIFLLRFFFTTTCVVGGSIGSAGACSSALAGASTFRLLFFDNVLLLLLAV